MNTPREDTTENELSPNSLELPQMVNGVKKCIATITDYWLVLFQAQHQSPTMFGATGGARDTADRMLPQFLLEYRRLLEKVIELAAQFSRDQAVAERIADTLHNAFHAMENDSRSWNLAQHYPMELSVLASHMEVFVNTLYHHLDTL